MRLATDIGGTFTDLVYVDDSTGQIGLAKASSTPPAFAQGIMDAIAKSGLDPSEVDRFVHGTTMVINALTERRGSATALVTTKGCRDVLEIGRGNRPDIYNLRFRKQPPFVPRERRFEVEERLDYLGRVVRPLDRQSVELVADQIRTSDAQAVAICLLHSYANASHEEEVAAILNEHLPGIFISSSSEITREWREYERTSTVVLNAYVAPTASEYLTNLETGLRELGIDSRLDVMKSNGGTQSFALSERQPIHMVESGPVGGVIGAAEIGRITGFDNLITLDIGGTTAKCSLIHDGKVKISTDYRIERDQQNAGYPVKAPVVDIVEIGAGGGSLVWIDAGGALKVGPISAGAVPGPACYGHGGTEPTVTDANLVAGRINPDYFLGGDIEVDIELSRKALEPIASHLGVSVDAAALGVIRIANANMINALKLVSVRRGYDPREFTLVAFGGGGAMHAAALGRELHVARVLVPPAPGHFSAWGMLMTDPMQDFIRTSLTDCIEDNRETIAAMFEAIESDAHSFIVDNGEEPALVTTRRSVDMRYIGQEHTVEVPVDAGSIDIEEMIQRFHLLHERAYTFRLASSTEIVNYRVVGTIPSPKPEIVEATGGSGFPKGTRHVLFDEWGGMEATVFERTNLGVGIPVQGPAVIEEPASTAVVYPDQRATLDHLGNIIIEFDRNTGKGVNA